MSTTAREGVEGVMWERIAGSNEAPTLERIPVQGGYLYRTRTWERVYNDRGPDWHRETAVAMVFVPMPNVTP